MTTVQRKMESWIGSYYLVASERGLQGIFWKPSSTASAEAERVAVVEEILNRTQLQLEEYFRGERTAFDLPLDAQGTQFQKMVWEQLARIPYGETRSYQDIARALDDPNASRAVGTANGRNPLSIVVPCHRVIASDGTLGGYAGGVGVKERLLLLEKRRFRGGPRHASAALAIE